MIVYDLKCESKGHVFEAWFSNSEGFESQKDRGLLSCPVCGDARIRKAAMAARVPKKGNANSQAAAPAVLNADDGQAKALIVALAEAQEKLLNGSQWVGRRFDNQARAMDSGEIEKATIHGEVTADQARALFDDGIAVTPLPFPVIPPEERN